MKQSYTLSVYRLSISRNFYDLRQFLKQWLGPKSHPVCLFVYMFVYMFVCLMVFNATFNNISDISWRSVLLVEETGGPGENHRPVASH